MGLQTQLENGPTVVLTNCDHSTARGQRLLRSCASLLPSPQRERVVSLF